MKNVLFLTPFALAALAGCAPAPNQIQAGQWEVVIQPQSLDIPGAPPEMLEQARDMQPRTNRICLTEEEARNFLQFLRRGQQGNCQYSDEAYAGGVLRQNTSCPGPAGQQGSRMTLDGRFTVTTFNGRINDERPNPFGANQGPVRSTAVIRGRRLGPCTATPPATPLPAPPPAPPAGAPAGTPSGT